MFDLEQAITDWRRQMQAAGIKTSVPLEELEAHLREDIDQLVQSGLGEEKAFEISTRQLGQPQILRTEFKKNGMVADKKSGIFALILGTVIILRILSIHWGKADFWHNDQTGWILVGLIALFWGATNVFFNFTLGDAREVRLWKLAGIVYSAIAVWLSVMPILHLLIFTPGFSARFGTTDRILAMAAIAASILSIFAWKYCRKFLPVIHNRRARTVIGIVACLSCPALIALSIYFNGPHMGHFPAPLFFVFMAWIWTAMAILAGAGYGLAIAARRQTTVAS